jgi:hypothetical protein
MSKSKDKAQTRRKVRHQENANNVMWINAIGLPLVALGVYIISLNVEDY